MKERLLKILEDICEDDVVYEDLDLELFEEGLLDSLAMAELLVALEDEFHVTLSPTEYDKEELATANKILKVLEGKGV